MSGQATRDVVMVRPHHFAPNPETIADNLFQPRVPVEPTSALAQAAFREVTRMVASLTEAGVRVHLFEDEEAGRPDSVFPNNWFTTHPDGRVALYPMYSPSRRAERRREVIDALRGSFRITAVHDYSVLEDDELYLEGTGSMVLDHEHRIAYVARSFRSHDRAVAMVCRDLGYQPVLFSTVDLRGAPIYHTNVMMAVGSQVALVALDSVPDTGERQAVASSLVDTGHTVVELSGEQLDEFAGNTIELTGADGPCLVISARAHASLERHQLDVLAAHLRLLPIEVPTIELAGGSVRCMIAGIHLPPRVDGRANGVPVGGGPVVEAAPA